MALHYVIHYLRRGVWDKVWNGIKLGWRISLQNLLVITFVCKIFWKKSQFCLSTCWESITFSNGAQIVPESLSCVSFWQFSNGAQIVPEPTERDKERIDGYQCKVCSKKFRFVETCQKYSTKYKEEDIFQWSGWSRQCFLSTNVKVQETIQRATEPFVFKTPC